MIVNFLDRILQMLERSNKSAVLASYVDWRGAFDTHDLTFTINKFIKLGVRSSLILLMIDYLKTGR